MTPALPSRDSPPSTTISTATAPTSESTLRFRDQAEIEESLMTVAGAVATILVLADVVMVLTVVVNSGLFFYSYDATSRVAGVIGLLSPAVLGAGVIWCSWNLAWSRWIAGLGARTGNSAEDM